MLKYTAKVKTTEQEIHLQIRRRGNLPQRRWSVLPCKFQTSEAKIPRPEITVPSLRTSSSTTQIRAPPFPLPHSLAS